MGFDARDNGDSQDIRAIGWINTGSLIWFAASACVTAFAFFAPGISFGWSLLPFAVAVVSQSRTVRFACVAGYFGWVAAISGWGLVNLGYSALLVVPAGMGLTVFLGAVMARLGIGPTCLVLVPLHMFPGNPLLATGSVFPGAGLYAIFLLAVLVTRTELMQRPRHRALTLLLIFAAGNAVGALLQARTAGNEEAAIYRTLDISRISTITERGYNQALGSIMRPGHTYITGENIIRSDNAAAISQWCRIVRSGDLNVILGVQNAANGQSQLWQFNTQTCPNPTRIYAAQTGVPGITGTFAQMWGIKPPGPIGFLACFEAFSIWRWIEVSQDRPETVVTVARDFWTEPLQVGLLRRKISRQFERLLSVSSFHAEAGKTLLQKTTQEEEHS
ncbi:hypothetical protein [uncultured Ruegeria sp.]|uniref:hypothetical protein n=1 Tax=uncultured Ruegeria sp. TaxID=259304 RepID=UPI0026317C8E|nr:hypothetical protein [uncultured Ruegeria sp.]